MYGRILDGMINVAAVVAASMLLLQVAAITLDVLSRYFFDITSEAVTSFSAWSLVYIAFLGAAWLQRQKGHVRIDIMIIRLPAAAQRWLEMLALLLGMFCCAVITWFGFLLTWEKFASKAYDFFALPYVPIWTIYIVIPFGALLFLLQLMRDMANVWSKPPDASAAVRATHDI